MMHRFFVSSQALNESQVLFPPEQAHQICSVLRMRPGQQVLVMDNQGWEYLVTLQQIGRRRVDGQIVERRPAANEPGVTVTVFQSLIKWNRFEWVLQKGTEIGVSRFVPMITRHSQVQNEADISPQKTERWRRIIVEAAEQSGRGRLPELGPVLKLNAALDRLDEKQLAIMPWERATGPDLRTVLPATGTAPVALFLGPEGGFAAEEVEYGAGRGLIPVTLGPRILRAETAAIVAASLVLFQLGELS
jgi:16S rRNA (uracil1498-N3)-methyltransferase